MLLSRGRTPKNSSRPLAASRSWVLAALGHRLPGGATGFRDVDLDVELQPAIGEAESADDGLVGGQQRDVLHILFQDRFEGAGYGP
jgi:hypothetical protein